MRIYLIGTYGILPIDYWTFGIPEIASIKYIFVDEATSPHP